MPRLIVTADDFGLSDGLNSGIVEAHREGIVTAASLVAVGGAFENAVSLASQNPTLDLGVHLALDEERPLLEGLQTLVGADGAFLSRGTLIRRLASGRIDLVEVERCWRAQIERVVEAGVTPTFVNSHGHVHALPALLRIASRLAGAFAIPAIRRPIDMHAGPAAGIVRAGVVSVTAAWSFARTSAPRSTDRFLGLAASGQLDRTRLARIVSRARGVTELMTHPGHADGETRAHYGHWGYRWEDELDALKDARALDLPLTTFTAEFEAA